MSHKRIIRVENRLVVYSFGDERGIRKGGGRFLVIIVRPSPF